MINSIQLFLLRLQQKIKNTTLSSPIKSVSLYFIKHTFSKNYINAVLFIIAKPYRIHLTLISQSQQI